MIQQVKQKIYSELQTNNYKKIQTRMGTKLQIQNQVLNPQIQLTSNNQKMQSQEYSPLIKLMMVREIIEYQQMIA